MIAAFAVVAIVAIIADYFVSVDLLKTGRFVEWSPIGRRIGLEWAALFKVGIVGVLTFFNWRGADFVVLLIAVVHIVVAVRNWRKGSR